MSKYAELMRDAAEYIDSYTPDNHPVPPVYHKLMQVAHDIERQEPVAEVQEHPYGHKSAWLVKTAPPENFYVGMKLYAAPQPAEQKQPYRQSPPDDPLGGLEHRADGEANFYTLSRPTGSWVARIQFSGEIHVHEQERILNAMLGDRIVCYGDGYHQGYWDARQDSPDVSALVEALDGAARSIETISKQAGIDEYMRDFLEVRGYARNRALVAFEALAAYRKRDNQ